MSTNTRKLILKMSISADGFVGGPDGEIDWIFKSMDADTTAWTVGIIRQAGLHIMGSRTFYDMRAWWPFSNQPFAPAMNEIPKAVFTKKGSIEPSGKDLTTTALKHATAAAATAAPGPSNSSAASSGSDIGNWAHPYIATGDLSEEILHLKRQPGKDILAHGGAGFAQSLVGSGLIDEYCLLVHPVVLGRGLPLFSTLPKPLDLVLKSATPFPGGAVAHVYLPNIGPKW